MAFLPHGKIPFLRSCLEYLVEKTRMETLMRLISIGYRAEALGNEGTHCEWEHFKDQTFCHALRRQPDSSLLSAQRAPPPPSPGLWGWTDRQRDRQPLFSILLQFCPAARMSHSSDVFCTVRRPPEVKRRLGWVDTGGSGPSVWVGMMKKAEGGEKKEWKVTWERKGGLVHGGQRQRL